MGGCGMLDQAISFADSVNARSVTIRIDKGAETLLVSAEGAPGILFSLAALRSSNGGITNDMTAIEALKKQLGNTRAATRAGGSGEPKGP